MTRGRWIINCCWRKCFWRAGRASLPVRVQYAEKDKQINRARKLLQQEPLPAFSTMTSIPADTTTLVLVPVGEVDVCVLSDLQRVLQVRLALSVLVRDVRVRVPPSRRDHVAPYLSQVRERLREGIKKDERLAAFLLEKDIRPEELEQDAGLLMSFDEQVR